MKQRKVVIAGHVCVDITPVFFENEVKEIQSLLKPGKLVGLQGVNVCTGGAVSNTGLAIKKMGMDTHLIGKIGNDAFGEIVTSLFKEYQAEKDLVVDPDTSTSYTIVLSPPGIDRIFLHNTGANEVLGLQDIPMQLVKEADWFHFGYPPLLKKFYVNEGKELVEMFREVKKYGTPTSLDMCAIEPDSETGKLNWRDILRKVLPYVDFFMPSIEELYCMIDREKYNWLNEKAGTGDMTTVLSLEEDIKPLAEDAIKLGAKNLLLKCGAPGLYYRMGDQETFQGLERKLDLQMADWYNREGFERGYKPEHIASATGAGDVTIAAFIVSILKGYSLEMSLKIATATGTSCVEYHGALEGVLQIQEQIKRIEGGLEKQTF